MKHALEWGQAMTLFHNRADVSVARGAYIEKICPTAPMHPDRYMALRVGRPMRIPLSWVLDAFDVPHDRIQYTDGHAWYIVWETTSAIIRA
jgi:hypothetical protein